MKLTYKQIPRKEIDKHCKQYCPNYTKCTKSRNECKRVIGFKADSKQIIMLSAYDSIYINYKMKVDRYREQRNVFINTVGR